MNEARLVEEKLCRAYAEERAIYAEMLGELNKASTPGTTDEHGEDWVRILDAGMANIARVEATIVAEKAFWNQADRVSGPEMKALVEGVAQGIQQLMSLVEHGFQSLRQRRDYAAPSRRESTGPRTAAPTCWEPDSVACGAIRTGST